MQDQCKTIAGTKMEMILSKRFFNMYSWILYGFLKSFSSSTCLLTPFFKDSPFVSSPTTVQPEAIQKGTQKEPKAELHKRLELHWYANLLCSLDPYEEFLDDPKFYSYFKFIQFLALSWMHMGRSKSRIRISHHSPAKLVHWIRWGELK